MFFQRQDKAVDNILQMAVLYGGKGCKLREQEGICLLYTSDAADER